MAVLLALLGVFVDYERTQTAYYADYVEKYCVPQGLFPLTKDQVGRRAQSWKFISRHWKVASVSRVNAFGTVRAADDAIEDPRPCLMKYFYRDNGTVDRVEVCDDQGKTQVIRALSADLNFISFKDASGHGEQMGETLAVQKPSDTDNTIASNTVAGWELVYGPDGTTREIHYRNSFNQPAADSNGLNGERTTYTAQGQLQALQFLDDKGAVMSIAGGLAGKSIRYDPPANGKFLGSPTHIIWQNAHGTEWPSQNNVAEETDQYDAYGNVTQKDYFDVHSNPVTCAEGYERVLMRYDDHGDILEWDCQTHGGLPMLNKHGFAKVTERYDARGLYAEGMDTGWTGNPPIRRITAGPRSGCSGTRRADRWKPPILGSTRNPV